ncbi:protein FAM161A isoform X1 [Nycticebus coucang]|uniref:protein FAM161A isoform X1 n=1 Tax=Nycticebus coucang TaxID=9470 RepID=UPI00234D763F|nr:protein FAM161A isoform X1 [Nycticebus coucang]XP_053445838.1 protein FAM161A isoform X1 [Nycticebus coucang]XP_053445839.1 protein FAM161A isoform X1 [Nycticebus coucang]
MAALHHAAKLAASNFHTPVNPNTGARVSLYEPVDPLLTLAAAADSLEEEEKENGADFNTNFSGVDEHAPINYEDFVNFSDILQSNEDYFRKLEELKTAHMQTMEKLEKMYQDKLNIKVLQPVIIKENGLSNSSRSVSEKNSYHPISLMASYSEPDLGRSSSSYMSSSEEELPNLEKEYPGKNGVMTYAKELINNMWTNFCVEDYIHCKNTDFQSAEKPRKKTKQWVPMITVPEPFQMMIREQKKKEEAMKSKPELEMLHKQLKNQEEDSECKKIFRANPVPASVLLPLYHELVKQNEERRRSQKEKSKAALLASQKPFKFIAREEQKRAAQEKQLRDCFKNKKKTNRFKARPLPRSIYGSITNDKVKEEELYGNNRTWLRARELSQNLSPVPCRSVCQLRDPKNLEQAVKLKYKSKGKYQTPDFEDLPERYQKLLPEHRYLKLLTVGKPFDLRASSRDSTKRDKILADIEADEEILKETRWPYLSPRRKSPVRRTSAKPSSYNPARPTVSSKGREQAIRRSLEEKKMLEEERNRILTKQKQRMKELQKLLTTRAKAYDSHQSLAQVSKSQVKYLRKSEKERMKEYRRELEEREEKLKHRPLLFERVAQKNARMAAEKHYSNTLKALGISDEFVSEKGQTGKVFEYLSNQETESSTEDKESFNEEENIEERENEEEHYFADTNSQDSCKEKDEADEESGEEKSVEE